jgi:peptidoglycan/LPS O-acetylase OafA/YrhL
MLKTANMTGRAKRPLQVGTAVLTGLIALSACGGVVGLVGGGLSFGATINARLPYGSLFLAGIALLFFVAAPMTIAAVASLRDLRHANDIAFGAALLLVTWIAIELAFIKSYSWFHPTYLGLGILVALCGWLLDRTDRPTNQSMTSRQAKPQTRPVAQ